MASKYRRKRLNKLVSINDIGEDMKLVDGSDTDYITPTAKIYKDYGDGYFYPKKIFQNKRNLYLYVNITYADGVNRNRRLHVLLAKAYLQNPSPDKLKYVGHKDNIKWHCTLNNLYWTNNKENIQKAVDDGLSVNDKSEFDSQSEYVKVIDKNTMRIVGVYGSIRQCARCVDNVDVGFIARMIKSKMYKPRSRKYIYQQSSEYEFNTHKDLQNIRLTETKKANKNPKVFRMTNIETGYSSVFDNQKQASKICGISQAKISNLVKNNKEKDGWLFEYLGEKEYRNSSGFKNLMNSIDDVVIRNINTDEVKHFDCKQHMFDYFGLHGNGTSVYFDKGHKIMHEWVVVEKEVESSEI